MAWTLVVALCIITFLIVAQLNKTFRIFQIKTSVYPSTSDIDQILPPEIIEAILSKADMDTLIACSAVSKYWRYHSKDQVFATVLETEKAPRVSLDELAQDLRNPNLKINWLTYHEDHYKPAWHLQDGRYIKRAGKKLIDVQYSSFSEISKGMKALYGQNDINPINKYIVRTRLRYSFQSGVGSYFYAKNGSDYTCVTTSTIPDNVRKQLASGVEMEVVEELSNLWNIVVGLKNPAAARLAESRNFIGGVPIDGSIFALMYLIFMPCIYKDFWSASADTKFSLTVLFASIGLAGVLFASAVVLYDGVKGSANISRARLCFGLVFFGFILFSVFYFQHALELGFYAAMETGLFFFCIFIYALDEHKHPNTKQVAFIAICIAISVVDWKLTVDAARNGALWYSLLYNLAMHAILWIGTVFVIMLGTFFSTWKLSLRTDPEINKFFAWAIVGMLYVTCAAPYTIRKVQR